MNPLFQRLYKHKKERVRDPNLPPAPTLLGQVKVIKDANDKLSAQAEYIGILERRIENNERKHRQLELYVSQLAQYIAKISKK